MGGPNCPLTCHQHVEAWTQCIVASSCSIASHLPARQQLAKAQQQQQHPRSPGRAGSMMRAILKLNFETL